MRDRLDHNNYEAWLLDRLDGNLTPEQERRLDAFLAAHPELASEFDELPTLGALEASLSAQEKNALKRSLPPVGLPGEPIDDFLIAAVEGDLSPEQVSALYAYMVEHPELMRAERLYALARVVPSTVTYADKGSLLRNIPPVGLPTEHSLDDVLVARLEGDLNDEQERALTAYLETHPQAQRSWALFQHTRVRAGMVVYPDKKALKKGGKVIPIGASRFAPWAPLLRAAAMVVLLFGLGFWALQREPGNGAQVAEVEHVPVVQEGATPTIGDTLSTSREMLPKEDVPSAVREQRHLAETKAQVKDSDPLQQGTKEVRTTGEPVAERVPEVDLLAARPTTIIFEQADRIPLQADMHLAVVTIDSDSMEHSLDGVPSSGISVGGFLAGILRKRVLETDGTDTRPLDGGDAVAAVDRGLKVVAGEQAGLQLQREQDGRLQGFDIRLGRNLTITAGR